jgi:hypothetical protein
MTGRTRFWASIASCVAAVLLLTVSDASLSAPKSKESADTVRKKCMAKVNELVAEDFPRWREHLLTECIEKGGKL